jgi:hypothetical protein
MNKTDFNCTESIDFIHDDKRKMQMSHLIINLLLQRYNEEFNQRLDSSHFEHYDDFSVATNQNLSTRPIKLCSRAVTFSKKFSKLLTCGSKFPGKLSHIYFNIVSDKVGVHRIF